MIYDVCIIGGGASGLAAAIAARREGAAVLVLERLDRIGKKLLATGNGKCNMTNTRIRRRRVTEDAYRSSQKHFAQKVLEGFDAADTIDFFESLGLYTRDKDGYIYPLAEQAAVVLDVLRFELDELRADIVTGEAVTRIQILQNGSGKGRFLITAGRNTYRSHRLILAAGGQSNKALGSDGSGYKLCRMLGHRILPVVPALCALKCREKFFKELAGVRVQGSVSLHIGGQPSAWDKGELQLTAYGISGIPVFQVSRYAAYGLLRHQNVTAVLDFMPEVSHGELTDRLCTQMKKHPGRRVSMILSGFLNKKLAVCLTKLWHDGDTVCKRVNRQAVKGLVDLIKGLQVQIIDTNGFEQSQVTAGGVDTREVNASDLSSRITYGLYITGELLDVDGICGGYNLQWAWATGILAGRAAGRRDND